MTNREYARFVAAAGHASPQYWVRGAVPQGLEDRPVVFINRYDVDAYIRWRTQAEGRVYRLPSAAEFEYAARGGLDKKLHPWGDEAAMGRANFDPAGSRGYDSWREHLQAVMPHGLPLHTIELQPFDQGETFAYLHYSLSTAGLEGEPPFNAAEFERIHRQAGGLPGRITGARPRHWR